MSLAEPQTIPTFADYAKGVADEFSPAREVLLNPYASEAAVKFACEILAESTNCIDACAVQKRRLVDWDAKTDLTIETTKALWEYVADDHDLSAARVIGWFCLAGIVMAIGAALVIF